MKCQEHVEKTVQKDLVQLSQEHISMSNAAKTSSQKTNRCLEKTKRCDG